MVAREDLPHNPYNMGNGGVWREGDRVHKVLTPNGEGLAPTTTGGKRVSFTVSQSC